MLERHGVYNQPGSKAALVRKEGWNKRSYGFRAGTGEWLPIRNGYSFQLKNSRKPF